MIVIKNKSALAKMRQAGKLLAPIVEQACKISVSGVSTAEVDAWIETELRKAGMVPRAKGYKGYKHVSCISVNDVVVHGVPSKDVILKPGDMVTIDVCASWKDYCADMARCFFVDGKVSSPQSKKLVEVAQKALDIGIACMVPGKRLSDISSAIQQEVESHGFGVIRDFAGHGIGKRMHEEPEVVNYGKPGKGPLLVPGMVLALEPMISLGDYKVKIVKDGWSAKMADGSLAAHVEDTVVITKQGPEILTRLSKEDI